MEIIRLEGGCWLTPDDAAKIRSRCIVLGPGEAVGEHDTGEREEVIIVLEGTARAVVSGLEYDVPAGNAFFIGRDTVHDVRNDGGGSLKYVYCVAL